jgi:hypothetical protein
MLANRSSSFVTVIALSVLVLTQRVVARSTSPTPNRLSDNDLETVMSNLKADAKTFRPLRFGNQEELDSQDQPGQTRHESGVHFEKQTSTVLNEFKRTRKGDSVPAMLGTAGQIEKIMTDLKLDSQTTGWDKIRTDLNQVSTAFGIAQPRPQPAAGIAQFPAYRR